MREERYEVDGIPAFWVETPEPYFAVIAFRVGVADETLPRYGTTHIVEHLAMSKLGRLAFPHNAGVSINTTDFYAEGDEDEVRGFITEVCQSIGDLPMDLLERERRVLKAETETKGSGGVLTVMQDLRFGPASYGLPIYKETATHGSLDWVPDWAAEWFTRQNAVIGVAGPKPLQFDIELPDGERKLPSIPKPVIAHLPALVSMGGSGETGVSWMGKRSIPLWVGVGLACERLREKLRKERGVSYGIAYGHNPWTGEDIHVSLIADSVPEHSNTVCSDILGEIEDLAKNGHTLEEQEEFFRLVDRQMRDPYAGRASLQGLMSEELYGIEPVTTVDFVERGRSVTPEQVAEAIAALKPTALAVGPDVSSAEAFGLSDLVDYVKYDEPVKAEKFPLNWSAGRFRGGKRAIHIDTDRIYSQDGEGDWISIPFAGVAAVLEHTSGEKTIFSFDGSYITFQLSDHKDSTKLMDTIRARIDPGKFVKLTEAEPVVDGA